ncbi:MAG: carboxypeptidase regulatory-like domain-containing protein [Phycisphaera sp. RhM]|nr:carboxypeptidase regulatory-like domain-containing protein [Phycisphaera sp. RhM]
MSTSEIEGQLERLAENWPGDSVVGNVVSRLPATTPSKGLPPRLDLRLYSWIGAIATLIVFAAALWVTMPQTATTALHDNLQNAQSWHLKWEAYPGRKAESTEPEIGDVWFDRELGFRMHAMGQVTVDDGTISHSWSLAPDETTVLKRPSMDGVSMVAEMCDLSQVPNDWRKQRSPSHDRDVGGSPCRAYTIRIAPANQTPADGTQRSILLLDQSDRLCQLIHETRDQNVWLMTKRFTIDYDRDVPASVFDLDFPDGAKIVDVQSALNDRFALRDAMATAEKDGILFAVHDLRSLDNGSYYVVSSVRGTPEYLEKYPATRRRVNLNYTAADVVSQIGSHCSIDGGTQVMMFEMQWQGAHYLWWLMRSEYATGSPSPKDANLPGKIRVPLIVSHKHKDHRDARGVQRQTRLELQVPLRDSAKPSLQQIVALARADMQLVSGIYGEAGSLRIAGSFDAQTVTFTSFEKVTNNAYAAELRKAQWQIQFGDFSGADPPEGFETKLAIADRAADEAAQPDPKPLSDEPTELPNEINGSVVDIDGKPIAGATVTIRVRRFGEKREHDGPGPWTATTDDQGLYRITPAGTIRPRTDEVRIDVLAEGYARISAYDSKKALLAGSFPVIELSPGRMISGRLVDREGKVCAKAIVRFQHNTEAMTDQWDSGPFTVDNQGRFAISIPVDGKAVGVVYPVGFAPRFIEVNEVADQGNIVLDPGVALKGRVLNRSGDGVAGTVVGLRHTEHREMFGYVALIGMAVKTDAEGYFQLPPLQGMYQLSVSKSAPDYSRQMMLVGAEPPKIAALTINTAAVDPKKLVVLKQAK